MHRVLGNDAHKLNDHNHRPPRAIQPFEAASSVTSECFKTAIEFNPKIQIKWHNFRSIYLCLQFLGGLYVYDYFKSRRWQLCSSGCRYPDSDLGQISEDITLVTCELGPSARIRLQNDRLEYRLNSVRYSTRRVMVMAAFAFVVHACSRSPSPYRENLTVREKLSPNHHPVQIWSPQIGRFLCYLD